MKSRMLTTAAIAMVMVTGAALAADTLKLAGKDGPGKGKKIVLIAGDEEYRSEETAPMLAKILSQKHGFDCVVVFSWTENYIDPNNQAGLRGLEELDNADLMIIGTRFRRPDEKGAAHITKYLNIFIANLIYF